MDYNQTINLPKTSFPMRGNLPAREPEFLLEWEENELYKKLIEKNFDKPKYILHDGPPYANGDIHLGTALNKILKDIIVKYRSMTGFCAPYIPGWDCHGLPIELKAQKASKNKKDISISELRKYCREFALSCLADQKKQFKRLGVLGDFDNPYITISPEYEARQVEVFGEIMKKGYIYKGLKPVYWCASCKTALAEAEIEYQDDDCTSIYVKFPIINNDKNISILKKFSDFEKIDIEKAFIVIWTTTTWTLPGNLAISIGPDYEYSFIKIENDNNEEFLLIAKELVEKTMQESNIKDYEIIGSIKGSELEFLETAHPFLDRKSPVLVGSHVTLDSGTGCVHTAPGFGVEDYEICQSYNHKNPGSFKIIVPVDEKGCMTVEAGDDIFGKSTNDANKIILENLKNKNLLLASSEINHSYPHCWRCHNPIIYRATDQWFCSVDKFLDKACSEINNVTWIPAWGQSRITNMVTGRSDWCISRQRRWGVPIPVFYCKKCGKILCDDITIKATSEIFRKNSSDIWYEKEASDILPENYKCSCGAGAKEFTKETDIFDVWFDSGCSHACVLEEREELSSPADLYLEGADQYRGWFQSSLLTCVAAYEKAPYKAVLTHGWVVDKNGRQMHKSLGNSILPYEVIKKYGADILRMWVVSSDYHADIRVSDDGLSQISEVYRKIRNTSRYILGNLHGFDPKTDCVPISELEELDIYALQLYNNLIDNMKEAYESTDFYRAYRAVNEFCVIDLSGFYLDIIKDRLYCETATGKKRRSAQTAMYLILHGLTKLLAPILAFTSEEIWKALPKKEGDDATSVLFNQMPELISLEARTKPNANYEILRKIRDDVLAAIEEKRAAKIIGKSLEASVTIFVEKEKEEKYKEILCFYENLAEIFIVSNVSIKLGKGEFVGKYIAQYEGLSITVSPASENGKKCERCWIYSDKTDENSLCPRCFTVVSELSDA